MDWCGGARNALELTQRRLQRKTDAHLFVFSLQEANETRMKLRRKGGKKLAGCLLHDLSALSSSLGLSLSLKFTGERAFHPAARHSTEHVS